MHTLIRQIADDDRGHDPWGAGITALFAVCDVLYVSGEPVPPETDYRPSLAMRQDPRALVYDEYTGENYQQHGLMAALDPDFDPTYYVEGYEPDLTVADLVYAARVLSRYLGIVEAAGLAY